MPKPVLILFGCTAIILCLHPQEDSRPVAPDLATPPMRNYSLDDYGLQPQNWAITQEMSGQMVFANQGGVLRYDGRIWEQLPIPGISALAILNLGDKLLVGGQKTLGYLHVTKEGRLEYREVPCALPIGRVYRLHGNGSMTIIQAQQGFFTLSYAPLEPFLAHMALRRVFESRGGIYFQTLDGSLYSLVNGKAVPLARLDPAFDVVTWLGHLDDRRLLLATHKNGLFMIENGRKAPFHSPMNTYLRRNIIISGMRLHNGNIALATRQGGLVVVDDKGSPLWLISKESGLQSNTVYCL